FVVYHNGVATLLGTSVLGSTPCPITGTTQRTCHDVDTAAISVSNGDTISILVTPAGSPTAQILTFGMVFTPTTLGQSIVSSNIGTLPSSTAAKYGPLWGTFLDQVTDPAAGEVAPIPMTVHSLYAAIDTKPASGTRTQTFRAGSASPGGGPTCGIGTASSFTIGGVSQPACADTTDTYQISSIPSTGSTPTILNMLTSGGSGAVATWYKTGSMVS